MMNRHLLFAAAVLVLALAPLFGLGAYPMHLVITALLWGFIYTCWSLMGRLGLVSFGHGAFIGVGAYTVVLAWNFLGWSPWLSAPIAVLLALALAAMVGWPCFRFGIIGNYFAIVTLALSEVVRLLIIALRDWTGGTLGVTPKPPPADAGAALWSLQIADKQVWFYVALIAWLIGLAVWRWVDRSMQRIALDAISEDEEAAASIGINVTRRKLSVTLLSAGLTCLGGVLYALYQRYEDRVRSHPLAADRVRRDRWRHVGAARADGGLGTAAGDVRGPAPRAGQRRGGDRPPRLRRAARRFHHLSAARRAGRNLEQVDAQNRMTGIVNPAAAVVGMRGCIPILQMQLAELDSDESRTDPRTSETLMSKKTAAEAASAPALSIDRPNQLLWHGDTPTKVPPKVFQLLVYLRDNPGRIIEYDELLDAVWPREFVQPEILKTYVKTIRRMLDDDAQSPRFIETRARCGYSFIGQLPDRCTRGSPAPSRLVGRDEPLARMQAGWRAELEGQRQIVFVVGEAGIGKTRLIDEFVSRVDDGAVGVCRVDCAQAQYAPGGFSPVRELSRALAGTASAAPPAADDEAVYADAAERLCREVEARAGEQPMIVVVENVQWADVATIEALSRLAYSRVPARLLLLASYRAAMPNDPRCPGRTLMLDLLVHGAATELRLTALASEDVKRLVLLNSPVPLVRGAAEAIDRYAGGNPLIVSLLVDRVVQQVRENGTSELADMLSRHEHECEFLPDAVPDVIRHSLELQLRQLGERTRTVLECGSNSGFAFCAWGVSKVMKVPQVEVEELCRAMCGSDQLLRESGLYVFPDGSVTPVYSFRNRLYARLLLTAQSPARRDAVQQVFTEAVEAVWGDQVGAVALEMTERFEAVREWSRALHYAKLAVQNAQRLTSRTDAVSLLQKGLKLSDHLPQNRRASEKDFFLSQLSKLG